MSYNYETQYDSPNFTSGNNGRKFIVCHWWDAPENNPSYEGVIATLCNPNRGASAHFVATGTGRRVACLVNLDDTAWHAGTSNPATNPNPISIGIECDPRCRDEDYDVVAELIANIRSAYGDLPLKRHSDFVATRCPGNWDLNRLDALARTKDGSGDWGVVNNIHQPIITTKTETKETIIPFAKKTIEDNTTTETRVITAGVNGKRIITYSVTYTDGIETKRSILSDITTPPVEEVTQVGTKTIPEPEAPTEPVNEPESKPEKIGLFEFIKQLIIYIIKLIKGER